MTQQDAAMVWRVIRTHETSWPDRSFLRRIPQATLAGIVDACRLVRFDPEQTLIEEGARDSVVYFLLSSYVKVTARLHERGHALLAVRAAGEVVGEIAITDGGRRSATVKACGREPVYAAALTRDDFNRVIAEHPEALLRLTQSISGKLRTSTRRRIDMAGNPHLVRIARVLLELAEDYGHPDPGSGRAVIIGVDISQLELGKLVGISEASVQRCLRVLRTGRLVNTRHRRTLVRDVSGLRQQAHIEGEPSPDGR